MAAVALALLALVVPATAFAGTTARTTSAPVHGERSFTAPLWATHVALHWRGARAAHVRVAVSRGDGRFSRAQPVQLDEPGAQRRSGETYGSLMAARGVRAVRVYSDRPLARLSVLWLRETGKAAPAARAASAAQPNVLRRADWGADESLRFNSSGTEVWPSAYYPVQKIIVHHTATQNNDPDPAATIRAIYYYHAVTEGWGDIGYNFLIDESGRVYEGRHTIDYPPGASPTEEDANGNVVTAAHTQGFNSGVVGIALLGTLSTQDATPAARSALEHLLAWEADRHSIDPQGSSLYTNPVSGVQKVFPNIAGHRDLAATECPGGTFYATLPTIRSDVAAMLAPQSPSFSLSVSPSSVSVTRGRTAAYTVTVTPSGGFTDPVSLSVSGLPGGATASFSPAQTTSTSRLTVVTSGTTPTGSYTLRITGTGGGLSRSTTAVLQVKRRGG
jgi:hypothetical protein